MRLISFLCFLLLLSCKKESTNSNIDSTIFKNGFLVLNEGLFNLNNASVSWVDLSNGKVTDDIFLTKTGRKLGDTGNDLKRYGDKIYIVVNVSSTLEILNAKTGNSIKQILMQENGIAKQPRNIVFYNGKAFVSCFDGYVDVVDTSSLIIEKRVKVGMNPENMVVLNNQLFVSNTGGLTPLLDSTISIVDCNTYVELSKIVVGKNPGKIVVQNDSTLYVHVRGNYASIPSSLKRISLSNNYKQEIYSLDITGIEQMEGKLLVFNANSVSLFDMDAKKIINPSFLSLSNITTLYHIQYEAKLKQLFVFDANSYTNSGYINQFSNSGQFIQKFHVGLNPNSLIYYE